jgi:hypothetical protein
MKKVLSGTTAGDGCNDAKDDDSPPVVDDAVVDDDVADAVNSDVDGGFAGGGNAFLALVMLLPRHPFGSIRS